MAITALPLLLLLLRQQPPSTEGLSGKAEALS